jgi:hypothetical protein
VDWFAARAALEPYHLVTWGEHMNLSFAAALALNAACDMIDVRLRVAEEDRRRAL